MDDYNERTSLVRSNNTLRSNSNNNNLNNSNSNNSSNHPSGQNHNNTSSGQPSRANTNPEDFARQDPRTFLTQVQRSLTPFQSWAAKVLHNAEDSTVVNWVQNARVARIFLMIINCFLAITAFVMIGVEMLEMTFREPILDYLLPESEFTIVLAGLTIVACAFGFAVAYNLLVEEEDTTAKGGEGSQNAGHHGGGYGSNGGASGPRIPSPPHAGHASRLQHTNSPKLLFSKASTYLLNGNVLVLVIVTTAFLIAFTQRTIHLSKMDTELNNAWTNAIRHREALVSDFELRHQCCGYNNIIDRPFPPDKTKKPDAPLACSKNSEYGFQVPCKAQLAVKFEHSQRRIQELYFAQGAMLLPLTLLVMVLATIGSSKLKERKQYALGDSEAQAEAAAGNAAVPAVADRRDPRIDRPLLEDGTSRNGGVPLLISIDSEPGMSVQNQAVAEPSLIRL